MSITKIISLLVVPLPFAIVCLFLGLFFLWVTSRHRLGRGFVTLGFLILVVFPIAPVSYSVLHPLSQTIKHIKALKCPTTSLFSGMATRQIAIYTQLLSSQIQRAHVYLKVLDCTTSTPMPCLFFQVGVTKKGHHMP